MSVDYWWCFLRVSEDEAETFQIEFNKAISTITISHEAQDALEDWRLRGWEIDPDTLWTCFAYQKSVTELAIKFLTINGEYNYKCDENHILEFIIMNRVCAPFMLWWALGPERSDRLPGTFGNFFVTPEDVSKTIELISSIFEDWDDEFQHRANSVGYLGNNNEEDAERLKSIIPNALEKVREAGEGLLVLSIPNF